GEANQEAAATPRSLPKGVLPDRTQKRKAQKGSRVRDSHSPHPLWARELGFGIPRYRLCRSALYSCPLVRQQLSQPLRRVIRQASKHVLQVQPGFDTQPVTRRCEAEEHRGRLATTR